jgi:sphingomyelin phosphodiesterase
MKALFLSLLLFAFLATTNASVLETKASDEYFFCGACKWIIGTVRKVLESKWSFKIFESVAGLVCRFMYTKEMCDEAIGGLIWPYFEGLVHKFLNETLQCKKMGMCKYPIIVKDNPNDYTYRVLKDKPQRRHVVPDSNDGNFTFVVFTDAHVDFEYEEGTEAKCKGRLCCRKNTYKREDSTIKTPAGKWGTVGNCDLPLRTLISFLNFTTTQIKPDFFIWLGDNNAHVEWNMNKTKHMKGSKVIADYFKEKGEYGNLGQVYPLVGNHEAMPSDNFDYNDSSKWWILEELGSYWSNWLTEECKFLPLIHSQRNFQTHGMLFSIT